MIVSFAESAHDDNQVCELCDKYVTLVIDYLQDYDNQNELVEALHISCSQIPPLKKQVFIESLVVFAFSIPFLRRGYMLTMPNSCVCCSVFQW